MSDKLYMRTNLLINASVENSRDLMKIQEAKKYASALRGFARDFKYRKFDVADHPEDGKLTLIVEWNSEEAEKHAERLIELAEEMEKEASEFYKGIGIKIHGEKLEDSNAEFC